MCYHLMMTQVGLKNTLTKKKYFVLKPSAVGGKNGVLTYIYNNNTRASLQLQS
jgi:hypothetical protein